MNKPQTNRPKIPSLPTVETLGPVNRAKKSRLRLKIFIPAASLLLLVATSAVYITSSPDSRYAQELSSRFTANDAQEVNSPDSVFTAKNIEAKTTETKNAQVHAQSPPKPTPSQPIVVFEPEGVFADKDKQDLRQKLVEPMVDYQPGIYAAIHVEVYSQDKFVGGSADPKYIVTTIGNQGQAGTGGFLFGSKKKALDWWQPECLETCQFSPEYVQKYPDVVKNSQM